MCAHQTPSYKAGEKKLSGFIAQETCLPFTANEELILYLIKGRNNLTCLTSILHFSYNIQAPVNKGALQVLCATMASCNTFLKLSPPN